MGKKENLISFADRTPEERKKAGSRGGKRSGEVKREKKARIESMRAIFLEYLNSDGADETINQCIAKTITKGGQNAVKLLEILSKSLDGDKLTVDANAKVSGSANVTIDRTQAYKELFGDSKIDDGK